MNYRNPGLRPSSLLAITRGTTSSSSLPCPNAATYLRLASPANPVPISTVPGLGIFFDKAGDPAIIPPSFTHFVRKFAARPEVLVFFHMRPLPVPTVPLGERFVVTRAPGGRALLPNCYSIALRHGYTDDVLQPGMARDLVAQIELCVSHGGVAGDGRDDGAVAAELEVLRRASEVQTVYVLGKEQLRIRKTGRVLPFGWCRHFFLSVFLWIRENSRTKLADLDMDADKMVEVGFVKDV